MKRRTCSQNEAATELYKNQSQESVVTNVLLQKMSSKRSSNRTLHQKVRGNKCSRCLQTEAAIVFFGRSLEGKRFFPCCSLNELATEVCEVHSKESAVSHVVFFGCSKPILLFYAKNESPLFFCSRGWRASENLGSSAKVKAR